MSIFARTEGDDKYKMLQLSQHQKVGGDLLTILNCIQDYYPPPPPKKKKFWLWIHLRRLHPLTPVLATHCLTTYLLQYPSQFIL